MHTIHHTSAFVLGHSDSGESNRVISLFTSELGLVKASAQSVREERSKLRYGLQELSYTRVALVRGREIWRITGAHEEWSVYRAVANDKARVELLRRISRLLSRLLAGEGKNDALFDTLWQGCRWLADAPRTADLQAFERPIVLRVLYHLGYVDASAQDGLLLPLCIESPEVADVHLGHAAQHTRSMTAIINESLRETQL